MNRRGITIGFDTLPYFNRILHDFTRFLYLISLYGYGSIPIFIPFLGVSPDFYISILRGCQISASLRPGRKAARHVHARHTGLQRVRTVFDRWDRWECAVFDAEESQKAQKIHINSSQFFRQICVFFGYLRSEIIILSYTNVISVWLWEVSKWWK